MFFVCSLVGYRLFFRLVIPALNVSMRVFILVSNNSVFFSSSYIQLRIIDVWWYIYNWWKTAWQQFSSCKGLFNGTRHTFLARTMLKTISRNNNNNIIIITIYTRPVAAMAAVLTSSPVPRPLSSSFRRQRVSSSVI